MYTINSNIFNSDMIVVESPISPYRRVRTRGGRGFSKWYWKSKAESLPNTTWTIDLKVKEKLKKLIEQNSGEYFCYSSKGKTS